MTNSLFDSGEDWALNACVNYGVDPWHLYAHGYRLAAETLTQNVRDTHHDQDYLIWPVLFLWRHHLELEIKSIARVSSKVLGQKWLPEDEHDLSQLFASAQRLFAQAFREFDERLPHEQTQRLRRAFGKFKAIDIKSVTFRYPEDLSGSKHLKDVTHINFDVVEGHMKSICDDLEEISGALVMFEDWRQSEVDGTW
ncbi:MAG: hypothetical protein ACYDHQ_04640 [Coriobacteriia bacterium]